MKKLLEIWKLLNTPIYTGKRLLENLRALTAVSCLTAGLGLVLIIIIDLPAGRKAESHSSRKQYSRQSELHKSFLTWQPE